MLDLNSGVLRQYFSGFMGRRVSLISGYAFWALFAATHERVVHLTSEANPLRLSVICLTSLHSLSTIVLSGMVSVSEKSIIEELEGKGHHSHQICRPRRCVVQTSQR
jgi:hypothetical protein